METAKKLELKCHFNAETKMFFDGGMSGTAITMLVVAEQNKDIVLKDEILINSVLYEATKIEIESLVLKRIYLREK